MKKPRFFYSEVLTENLPLPLYHKRVRGKCQAILIEKLGGAERDQPKEQPQRAHAGKRQKCAVENHVSRAAKEQQVKTRQRKYGGAKPE